MGGGDVFAFDEYMELFADLLVLFRCSVSNIAGWSPTTENSEMLRLNDPAVRTLS